MESPAVWSEKFSKDSKKEDSNSLLWKSSHLPRLQILLIFTYFDSKFSKILVNFKSPQNPTKPYLSSSLLSCYSYIIYSGTSWSSLRGPESASLLPWPGAIHANGPRVLHGVGGHERRRNRPQDAGRDQAVRQSARHHQRRLLHRRRKEHHSRKRQCGERQ